MALSMKHEDVEQVPWLSLAEWHDVYKQIYSNDAAEQAKAYKMLLVWKARIPKLPVGVDCTLSILQVCLCDREWTSKINSGELPMCYENNLSLMYSTTIMRFLNHISNIGHTKEMSLFKIAKQLKIPEWIVDLRHQAAHGHELPSISVLRIAINILFEWLHDEYWATKACAIEEYYTKENIEEISLEEGEFEEMQAFADLIEIWSAITLYIDAGYDMVIDVPDTQLREALENLRTYMLSQYNSKSLDKTDDKNESIIICKKTIKLFEKEYNLKAAQALLLSEISVHLTENEFLNKKGDMICDILCKNTAFLPNSDMMKIFQQKEKNIESNSLKGKILPSTMLQFWKDIIFLLHRKEMLEILMFKLINIVNQATESKERRTSAALWISSIIYSFIQLDIAQNISYIVEHKLKKVDTKTVSQYVKNHLRSNYPHLQNVLWLDITSTIPHFLTDINFLSKLILDVNEFSQKYVEAILKLSKVDAKTKKHFSHLVKTYTGLHIAKCNNKGTNNDACDKIYTVEDFRAKNEEQQETSTENEEQICTRETIGKRETTHLLADQVVRNLHWKPALDHHQWVESPIGLLPWQIDSLKSLEPLEVNIPKHPVSMLDSQINAGIINYKNLRMQSSIKWDDVLRKKRRIIRKRGKPAVVIMDRTLEIIKK